MNFLNSDSCDSWVHVYNSARAPGRGKKTVVLRGKGEDVFAGR